MPEAVKVSVKRSARGGAVYEAYAVAIPKKLAEALGLKGGDLLLVDIIEHEGRRGIFYFKP